MSNAEGEDDDDWDRPARRQCVDCKTWAPETRSAHTLISTKHGWRLHRAPDANGTLQLEWLCAACWSVRKASGRDHESGQTSGGQDTSPPASPPPRSSSSPLSPGPVSTSGAFEMMSSVCKSVMGKLRTRAQPGLERDRLLRRVGEIESEIATWPDGAPRDGRRKELWDALLSLNQEADELLKT